MLFCSEICSEFARAVRYERRVTADGRIVQPDVNAAVAVRRAYAVWGQAPAKPLPATTRAAVFAAKGHLCFACGAPATDVDHVVSAAFGDDSLANLQPLCRSCHKLPTRFGFAIEYTDNAATLRYYEPDFVAVDANGGRFVIETKGREDIDVAHKDRAARIWAENATLLTETYWDYVKVPQGDFERLQPADFADLRVAFGWGTSSWG